MADEAKALRVSVHGNKNREQGMLQGSISNQMVTPLTPGTKHPKNPLLGARGKSQEPSPRLGKHGQLKKAPRKKVSNPGGEGSARRCPAKGGRNSKIWDSTRGQPSGRRRSTGKRRTVAEGGTPQKLVLGVHPPPKPLCVSHCRSPREGSIPGSMAPYPGRDTYWRRSCSRDFWVRPGVPAALWACRGRQHWR